MKLPGHELRRALQPASAASASVSESWLLPLDCSHPLLRRRLDSLSNLSCPSFLPRAACHWTLEPRSTAFLAMRGGMSNASKIHLTSSRALAQHQCTALQTATRAERRTAQQPSSRAAEAMRFKLAHTVKRRRRRAYFAHLRSKERTNASAGVASGVETLVRGSALWELSLRERLVNMPQTLMITPDQAHH